MPVAGARTCTRSVVRVTVLGARRSWVRPAGAWVSCVLVHSALGAHCLPLVRLALLSLSIAWCFSMCPVWVGIGPVWGSAGHGIRFSARVVSRARSACIGCVSSHSSPRGPGPERRRGHHVAISATGTWRSELGAVSHSFQQPSAHPLLYFREGCRFCGALAPLWPSFIMVT